MILFLIIVMDADLDVLNSYIRILQSLLSSFSLRMLNIIIFNFSHLFYFFRY
jgi:hypothetical protein